MGNLISLGSGVVVSFLLGAGLGYFIVNILSEVVGLPNFILNMFSKEKMADLLVSIFFAGILTAFYQHLPFGTEKANTLAFLIGLALYVIGDKDRITSNT